MIKDLTEEVRKVYATSNVEEKKKIVIEMIQNSYAKNEKKRLMITKANMINNARKLDELATNYAMSGEGLKVR